MKAIEISQTGMDVEWRRLEVIAQNLANANSVVNGAGAPFRAMRLLSGPKKAFHRLLETGGLADDALAGVEVYGLTPIDTPPRVVHEPGNPQADAHGDVTYPGVDRAAEMTLMLKTARVYEANVVAMNLARQMYLKALEIGR